VCSTVPAWLIENKAEVNMVQRNQSRTSYCVVRDAYCVRNQHRTQYDIRDTQYEIRGYYG